MPRSAKVEEEEELSYDSPREKPVEREAPILKKIDVVAIRAGFYKNDRKAVDAKFTIEGEHQFSKHWMKKI